MPFNTLLLTCLHPGTSFGEVHNRVSVQQKSDEPILFFVTDDQSNSVSTLRSDLKMGGAVCDLVIFYAQGNKKTLCLVELKGSDLEQAVEQIINTYQHLKRTLKQPHRRLIGWKAYIQISGSIPKELKELQKSLHNIFGKHNYAIARDDREFANFIRN